MALSARKEDLTSSNAMTKSNLSFKTALIPSVVRDDPQIYLGRSADVEETEGMSTLTEERGDLLTLIRNKWKHQTDCILDVRILNLDAPSNIHRKPEAVLLYHEREKRKKYLQPFLDQRRHFSLFVISCDGVLGNEAKVVSTAKPCRRPRQNQGRPIPKLQTA